MRRPPSAPLLLALALVVTAVAGCPPPAEGEGEAGEGEGEEGEGEEGEGEEGEGEEGEGEEGEGEEGEGEEGEGEGEGEAAPEVVVAVAADEGGVVALGATTLEIPAGALGADVAIEVSADNVAVAGFDVASEVFTFGPSGTEFLTPIRVTIPFAGDPTGKVVFLSTRDGTGFEPVPTTFEDGAFVAFVSHFSSCFVGEDASAACDDVVCDDVPADACSGDVLSVFGRGACVEGDCVYASTDLACADVAFASGACVEGACVIAACDDGRDDCNGAAFDGCEANLAEADTCGSCARACGGLDRCDAGACVAAACAVDADCGDVATCTGDGRVVDTFVCESDVCVQRGSSGESCGDGVCAGGACRGCFSDSECPGEVLRRLDCPAGQSTGTLTVTAPRCDADGGCSTSTTEERVACGEGEGEPGGEGEGEPVGCDAVSCGPVERCEGRDVVRDDRSCDVDRCVLRGSQRITTCPEACSGGRCVPLGEGEGEPGEGEGEPGACVVDDDCGGPARCFGTEQLQPADVCRAGRCAPADPVFCDTRNPDEGARTFCVELAGVADCRVRGGDCVEPGAPCDADDQCSGGVCNVERRCSAGASVPCTSPDGCGPGGFCEGLQPGRCSTDSAPCFADVDCSGGGTCAVIPGTCRAAEGPCQSDVDCGGGGTCAAIGTGFCSDPDPCPPELFTTCRDGAFESHRALCEVGYCQYPLDLQLCTGGAPRCEGSTVVHAAGTCDDDAGCGSGADVVDVDCAATGDDCRDGACVPPGSTCAPTTGCDPGPVTCDGDAVVQSTPRCAQAAPDAPFSCVDDDSPRPVAFCADGCVDGGCRCDTAGQDACGPEAVCTAGACVRVACAADVDCPTTTSCEGDIGVKTTGFRCDVDHCVASQQQLSDCGGGAPTQGTCAANGAPCRESFECPPGDSCVVPPPQGCVEENGAASCQPRGTDCTVDGDCGVDVCDGDLLVTADAACDFGHCVARNDRDLDCAADGGFCADARCQQCRVDDECDAPGTGVCVGDDIVFDVGSCVDGQCGRAAGAGPAVACPDGPTGPQHCRGDRCIDADEACFVDTDCGSATTVVCVGPDLAEIHAAACDFRPEGSTCTDRVVDLRPCAGGCVNNVCSGGGGVGEGEGERP